MRKTIVLPLLICITMIALCACSADQGSSVDQGENLVAKGKILEASQDGNSILVDSVSENVTGKIRISFTEDTSFDVDNRDFEVGGEVEIILDGYVLESDPMQATAMDVILNKKADQGSSANQGGNLVVKGEILEISKDDNSILVDSESEDVTGEIWVSFTEETSDVENTDFEVGGEVEIVLDGNIVLESHPMKATGMDIILNKKAE